MQSTTSKLFHFINDAEGWTCNIGDNGTDTYLLPKIRMGWKRPKIKTYSGNNYGNGRADCGGSMHTTISNDFVEFTNSDPGGNAYGNDAYLCSLNYSGTWQSFGVPSGAIVTRVYAEYYYRWFGSSSQNNIYTLAGGSKGTACFPSGNVASGPFMLNFNSGNNIVLSSLRNPEQNNIEGKYTDSSSISFTPNSGQKIGNLPINWGYAQGSWTDVPSAYSASSTPLSLKLSSMMCPLVTNENITYSTDYSRQTDIDPSAGSYNSYEFVYSYAFLRLQQDRILISVDYTYNIPQHESTNFSDSLGVGNTGVPSFSIV